MTTKYIDEQSSCTVIVPFNGGPGSDPPTNQQGSFHPPPGQLRLELPGDLMSTNRVSVICNQAGVCSLKLEQKFKQKSVGLQVSVDIKFITILSLKDRVGS